MISGSRTSGSAPPPPLRAAPRRSTLAVRVSRRLAADAAAAAVVATVAPLCFLQAPNAIAWAMASVGTAADGTQRPVAVLRAAGLALPAMAAVGGVAALAASRLRGWPVLVTGLLTMAVADGLGVSARTVGLIGADRILHGLAAGVAMPAALALTWERSRGTRQLLAALWAAAAVTGLVAATAVVRARVSGGDWHNALVPCPWLTWAALTVAALYGVLADGPRAWPGPPHGTGRPRTRATTRADVTRERAQLAILAVPAIGLSLLSVAVTYRRPDALLVTAFVSVLILYGAAVMASADKLVGGRLCFPLLGAVTGLVVAPAAGAVTCLRALGAAAAGITGPSAPDPGRLNGPSWLPLATTAISAAAGAAIALAMRRWPRAVVLAGLAVAGEGLVAAYVAGPFATGPVLAGVSVPLAAGLTAAITAALCTATAASALSGVSLLLAGLMTGYLAVGSVQVRMVMRLAAPLAARGALARAAGLWELAGAASVVTVMVVIFVAGRARRVCVVGRGRG